MWFKRKLSLKALQKLRDDAVSCWCEESKSMPERAKSLEEPLKRLDASVIAGDVEAGRKEAPFIQEHLHSRGGKLVRGIKELVITLIIALAFAGVARQSWFELYEIPTGSMRPTFKECDRVLVSKTAYGINIPFQTNHLAFNPSRVRHGSITVITGDGLPLPDVDTMYFGLFPGKRRYVKRCVALPEESIYFYGGNIYCLSADGSKVTTMPVESCPNLEYVPFLQFDGTIDVSHISRFGKSRTYTIKHFNLPVGKVTVFDNGAIESKIAGPSGSWVEEFSESESARKYPRSIGEFWGISNYAQARLLLPSELPKEANTLGYTSNDAMLYVELKHSPTLPKSQEGQSNDFNVPLIATCTSWIPLSEKACEEVLNNLYTARFVVRGGKACRYNENGIFDPNHAVTVPDRIPDGTYEFYHGKAYLIRLGSFATELESDHPIYPKNDQELQLFYNVGIEWYNRYEQTNFQRFPSRYAYFRNGGFYLLGHEIVSPQDPLLQRFEALEIMRQSKDYSYFAFQDIGSPIDEHGGFNPDFFKNFGLTIPKESYVLLGDNHAMSLDSRIFGVVPENNIQGTTVLRFWPTQGRVDETTLFLPPQPYTGPSMYTLLISALMIGILWAGLHYFKRARNLRLNQFREAILGKS